MRIAVWDEPPLDFLAKAASELSEHYGLEVLRLPRRPIRDMLIAGEVDVALLPTLQVYLEYELFDVLPAVAVSSWNFPYLRLHLKKGIGHPIDSIWIDPSLAQEALITKIILKEHYELTPEFKPYDGNLAEIAKDGHLDGTLVQMRTIEPALEEGISIDLGRDWFELTHYPMVWGLFVMKHGEGGARAVNILRDIASYTEIHREQWSDELEASEQVRTFYKEGIRYRLDDLATASLTTFQDYLYFNNAVDEMSPLSFYEVSEGEAEDGDGPFL